VRAGNGSMGSFEWEFRMGIWMPERLFCMALYQKVCWEKSGANILEDDDVLPIDSRGHL
jgi:hypothetical protein